MLYCEARVPELENALPKKRPARQMPGGLLRLVDRRKSGRQTVDSAEFGHVRPFEATARLVDNAKESGRRRQSERRFTAN
jgi:hypothetical protein